MDWRAALDLIEPTEPHAWRLRQLCEDDSNPRRRDGARRHVVALAGGAPEYPSVVAMAGNALKAAAGFVASGFALASDEERERRLAICGGCDRYDAAQQRCTACGCFNKAKAAMAASKCPLGHW